MSSQPTQGAPVVSTTGVSVTPTSSLFQPPQAIRVATPSGQTIEVLGAGEEAFYSGQAKAYQDENAFTNNSDLLDLDRLVFLELIVYRMTAWLGRGIDYDGMDVDRRECQRTLKETSDLISKVKSDLGLTKAARDKAQYEDVGTYLVQLKQRAREFGVHREKQLGKALGLTKQLFSIIGSYDRSDEIERDKLGFRTDADIVQWIRDVYMPQFNAVDEHFRNRKDGQRYWARSI
jgi:hypothetical protein